MRTSLAIYSPMVESKARQPAENTSRLLIFAELSWWKLYPDELIPDGKLHPKFPRTILQEK